MVTCPACGRASRDAEFCDHCNADLLPPAAPTAPAVCPLTPGGPLSLTPEQAATLTRPEAAVTVATLRQAWRLHWIPRAAWPRWRPGVEEPARHRAEVLPPCRVVQDREGVWVAAEAAPLRPLPWHAAPVAEPLDEVRRLAAFLDPLADALAELHARSLVWLTFDPHEIELLPDGPGGKPPGRVRFTNLDLAVYPVGRSPEQLRVNPKFAPPEVCRFRAAELGPATDVFHLAIFSYYWLARLLPEGFSGSGLEAFGHVVPPLRVFAPRLPPGIAAVLSRGLAAEPSQRFASPAVFRDEFRAALERAAQRAATAVPIRWEIGIHTRAGLAKSALSRPNEDCALVRPLPGPQVLTVVADGISTCDVGSGDLASRTTCALLGERFGPTSTLDSFAARIAAVCREASGNLLDWALKEGHRQQLVDGLDLMGTTLTAAWLEGNRLALANLGDSRAYLVRGATAEQLTVDGDMACTLLAAGVPPEDVREIGPTARALRDCIGGCTRGPAGEPVVQEKFCVPAVSIWRLLPGDFVVLCTDGLVEEGVFLDPADVAKLLRRHRALPAMVLAVKLADAADARQRPPSALEPQGFGDNISCVVIKVLAGDHSFPAV